MIFVILDLIIAGVLLAFGIWGMQKGLVRALFNLGRKVVALILALLLYPMVSSWIFKTDIPAYLQEKLVQPFLQNSGTDQLPSFLQPMVGQAENGIVEGLVLVLAVLLLYLIISLLLRFISKSLNMITKLPVIHTANKLGGFVFGLLGGVILVYILMALQTVLLNETVFRLMEGSYLANRFYQENLLLLFFSNLKIGGIK